MEFLSEIGGENLITVAAIVIGAIILFWVIHKLVKLLFTLAIVAIVATLAVVYCVKAGYLSRETAEKLNPLNSVEVRSTIEEAKNWAGDRAKQAAKEAVRDAVSESGL